MGPTTPTSTTPASTTTTTTTSTTTTVAPTLKPRVHLGCYLDMPARDLSGSSKYDDHLTIDNCIKFCKDRRFIYAGVQHGNNCFCGDTYGKYGHPHGGTHGRHACDDKCKGNRHQICGGA